MMGLGHSPFFQSVVAYKFYLCFPHSKTYSWQLLHRRLDTLILVTVPRIPVVVLSHPNMTADQDKIMAVVLITYAIYWLLLFVKYCARASGAIFF